MLTAVASAPKWQAVNCSIFSMRTCVHAPRVRRLCLQQSNARDLHSPASCQDARPPQGTA
jgi:hypothetical protein